MIPDLIYCAAGNPRFAEIAIRYGFRYGAQLPNTVYHPVEFADQDWKAPDRGKYMAALAKHRPRLATVLDLEREDQLDEVLSWAAEAAQHVTEAVIIIPKAMGIIGRLPRTINGREVRLGYSVPTSYGGTSVPAWEFDGWPVHLLGGSPKAQVKLRQYMRVASADTNYHTLVAVRHNKFIANNGHIPSGKDGDQPSLKRQYGTVKDGPYVAFQLSCMNIRAAWLGAPCSLMFAREQDIPAIKVVANQYKNELGFVNSAALRTAIDKREVVVAIIRGQVVGFVNYHARRDGWHTVYEIAVRKDWRGHRIGAALLEAVPRPVRLKCTVDNDPANTFYTRSMELAGVEAGRKRALNVWVTRGYADATGSGDAAGGTTAIVERAEAGALAAVAGGGRSLCGAGPGGDDGA